MPEIKYQNKNIFYAVSGQGPAIILLHGFGENHEIFSNQVAFLEKDYKIILPDLPGSGRSEILDKQPSLDDFADIVAAIAENEIPGEKFSLFGHSMGGYTTMAFVEKYSDRLQTFGLIHSSAYADTAEKIEIRNKAIAFIEDHGGETFLKTITANLFAPEQLAAHPQFFKDLLSLSSDISDQALIQYYHAMISRPDRSALLESTSLPVLFIIGKHDTVIPYPISLKQAQKPAKTSVFILNESGHIGMWEEKDKTNHSLREFLRTFV